MGLTRSEMECRKIELKKKLGRYALLELKHIHGKSCKRTHGGTRGQNLGAAVSRLLRSLLLVGLLIASPGYAQTIEYIHTDALGSPVAITDANGNVIERSEYEPYGAMLNRPADDRPGYTGRVVDATTGLNYVEQRYHDAGIGRFLSVDP